MLCVIVVEGLGVTGMWGIMVLELSGIRGAELGKFAVEYGFAAIEDFHS